MLASELFAISQGAKCAGKELCHWCGAETTRLWQHDDPTPVPFTKNKSKALRPGSNYICIGCWLWRRKRVTVFYLDGSLLDGQAASDHSWLLTREKAEAIDIKKPDDIYPILLCPPREFSLSFIEENHKNLLQSKIVNSYEEVKAETKLMFTLNNIVHNYCVYELEEALKHGGNGKEPGTQALLRLLGPWKMFDGENGKEVKRGRPTTEDKITPDKALRKVVSK